MDGQEEASILSGNGKRTPKTSPGRAVGWIWEEIDRFSRLVNGHNGYPNYALYSEHRGRRHRRRLRRIIESRVRVGTALRVVLVPR